MESHETADTPRKTSAGMFATAASTCILGGIGLAILLMPVSSLLDGWGYVDVLNAASLIVAGGSLYLAAPVFGMLACGSLLRSRRLRPAADHSRGHGTARRFGRAALLFGLGAVAILLCWPGGGSVTDDRMLARLIDVWLTLPAVLAIVMGIVSYRLAGADGRRGLGRVAAISAVTMGLGTTALPSLIMTAPFLVNLSSYHARSPTFHAGSDSLERTVVVPTLDSPMPPGKNVIWCSSFQLAWNELRDRIIGAPVQLAGAQELADRLNAARQSRNDLDPSSCLVVTGSVATRVLEDIRTEMTHRFPDTSVPTYDNLGPNDLVMYAYLEAEARFKHPFDKDDEGMRFTDSQGRETTVASFGVWDDAAKFDKLRGQVRVLYCSTRVPDHGSALIEPNEFSSESVDFLPGQVEEFALDLCRYTQPYQIILAMIDPKPTLQQTLEYLDTSIACFSESNDIESLRELSKFDKLYVPELFWEIEHRFAELEGQKLANPAVAGLPIKVAEQMIHFRLDRCGAVLRSRATLVVELGAVMARTFAFDEPFLICMKKRGCEQPFFVMWVDNAELMKKRDERGGR